MKLDRSLYWKLNWYRQSELDGALLLGKAVRAAEDPYLIHAMTRHAAEEARHAEMWAETIAQVGCPWVRILRSYQSYYGEFGAMPATLTEVLALTHVFERRVERQFREERDDGRWPPVVRTTLSRMLEDERRHLNWVREFLAGELESAALLERYAEIDGQVYERLLPYEERLWDLPGLGIEWAPERASSERHAGQ